jgi:hypothetical protein
MAKGMCFEYVINEFLKKKEFVHHSIKAVFTEEFEGSSVGYEFIFGDKIINEILDYLMRKGAHSPQCYICRNIELFDKNIQLYGIVDYCCYDSIVDLKTTGYYLFPKYNNSAVRRSKYEDGEEYKVSYGSKWQLYVYGYCMAECISEVEFLVAEFPTNEPPEIYNEQYSIDEIDFSELTGIIRSFIEFLEANRSKITDKKVFGGENEITTKSQTSIKLYSINNGGVI